MSDLDEQAPDFQLRRQDGEAEVRLQLIGELDLGVADAVRAALAAAEREAPARIVVDIDGLRFMDSTGLALLVEARENARQAAIEFLVTQPRAQVRRLFQLTGMLDGFKLAATD